VVIDEEFLPNSLSLVEVSKPRKWDGNNEG